jgi:hypothetical protein
VVRFPKQELPSPCAAQILLSCLSHYVTVVFLYITRYKLLFDDWRGYLVAGFSLVAVANLYMSLFGRLRGEIKEKKVETALAEAACRRNAMRCTLSHPSAPNRLPIGSALIGIH